MGYDEIVTKLDDLNPKTVGKAFGIVKITVDGYDIDLNVPRRDNKVGVGHAGFECSFDPQMTVKEAARRRDFTINSMAMNVVTGKIIDPFGGRADLDAGILRATDPEKFIEDELRPLRAMQLLARKAKTIDPATMNLIRGMHSAFPKLAKERVHEECRKLVLKADNPSIGINFLVESGWISWFPELAALMGCEQKRDWHPEGDAYVHSLLTVDAAAEMRHVVPEHQREAFMFGALLHDVGKPSTTITQSMVDAGEFPASRLLTAHGHDTAGGPIALRFMERLTNDKKLLKLVEAIVIWHMQPYQLCKEHEPAGFGAFVRLHNKMRQAGGDLKLIAHQCQCDACATSVDWKVRSLATGSPNWEHRTSQTCLDHFGTIEANAALAEPLIGGKDLIALGIEPGPAMGWIIKECQEIQYSDSGLSKEQILAQVLPSS
jgi:tRNA nucleotidyltransferase (CCA-adding enzyme)